jgi:hypothetical protein
MLILSSLRIAAQSGGESGPFIVGAWKLVCDNSACKNPIVDTEFRFTNPSGLTLTLEYAFFENDGTFCGCDRDTLPPNKTTVYTASGERNSNPSLMQCKGNSGALKSIVFASHDDNIITVGDAQQAGFQTHLFGGIQSGPDATTSFANTMAEAGMNAIGITSVTSAEIIAIHSACVNFAPVGPLH